MQLVFCGSGWPDIVDVIRAGLPQGASIRLRDFSRPLVDELAGAHVILPSNARIDAAAVAAPRDLRLIQQPAAGFEGVDLAAAAARGVPVCNAPGANGQAVAEASLLLLLALARRLPAARRAFAERRIGQPLGAELGGKTLLVVGVGSSGGRLAAVARGLGMEVLIARSTTTRAELLGLLARAAYVSLHCPLGPATRHLIDAEALAALPRGACLVNCARGAIVDRAAAEAALASGQLGGLGLDTFWAEPWEPADPLYARDDVVTLPHVAGSTHEAYARIAAIVCDNVARVMRGDPPRFRVPSAAPP